jgi:hypothetical protein
MKANYSQAQKQHYKKNISYTNDIKDQETKLKGKKTKRKHEKMNNMTPTECKYKCTQCYEI